MTSKESTINVLKKLHKIECPTCPNMSEKFKTRFCLSCTEVLGYGKILEKVKDIEWLD